MTLVESLAYARGEIDADLKGVDVHEHVLFAESRFEVVVQTACVAGHVAAPIADEDARLQYGLSLHTEPHLLKQHGRPT